MTTVRFGPPPFCLHAFVQAAIGELGYFRVDSADALTNLFVTLWPRGISSTMLIYNDLDPMTEEEKRTADLPRARMPRSVWLLLSEVGRADAERAITATTTHIILAVQRERQKRA